MDKEARDASACAAAARSSSSTRRRPLRPRPRTGSMWQRPGPDRV